MSTVNDDSSNSNKHYTFTIDENNRVTAYFEVENGVSTQESIDSDDFFEVTGTTITQVKSSSNDPVEIVYSDPEADGTYVITSDSSNTGGDDNSSGGGKEYKFTIVDGVVTEVFEIKDGEQKPDPISDSESYSPGDNNTVIRTDLIEGVGSEMTVYGDTDNDGIYHRISEQWAPDTPGAGPFKITERLVYSPEDGIKDENIAVRDGEDCHGGGGKDQFVLREAGNLLIADYSSSDDDLIVFDTGLGLTSKEEVQGYVTDLHYEGDDLVVVFGSAATVTLVGVPSDQITWDDVSVLS